MTVSTRLTESGNRPAGFDYLRLALAVAVVVSHTTNIVYGRGATQAVWHGPWRLILAPILPMFFALSGFLVAGSLERSATLVSFLGLRIIRLAPALAVDTIIAALIIGPMFTSLSPLRDS